MLKINKFLSINKNRICGNIFLICQLPDRHVQAWGGGCSGVPLDINYVKKNVHDRTNDYAPFSDKELKV